MSGARVYRKNFETLVSARARGPSGRVSGRISRISRHSDYFSYTYLDITSELSDDAAGG